MLLTHRDKYDHIRAWSVCARDQHTMKTFSTVQNITIPCQKFTGNMIAINKHEIPNIELSRLNILVERNLLSRINISTKFYENTMQKREL